ncbi:MULTISPECIES: D-tagatose-bisphosphate aldolase, class II, non-catalytic subunit [Pseudoalteromonas]|uniref:D-tagatose-bisphosphate aldolase, class II, non-catalytic subunit n=1 Tax=Pseudoalteromonas TaxID=53246 RepID=UPI0021AD5DC3|nr:D-tagatose-bisphosphate aldolase, class II, non-catalytic subunit [Pseudoalteromonas flavipulchra]USE70797.1 D-tagatose-bisphosphate aldolase, class II, non-catalytic subunit [Pseudoalteromonas flavipulchra]
MRRFQALIEANKSGKNSGIYAICSAHPWVLEASIRYAKQENTLLLIEATANQVNQFGGYTGMRPADFIAKVEEMADELGFDKQLLIFGGDHLGPVCWTSENSQAAMAKACDLVAEYVKAGFKKVHLDASMPCADDPDALSDDIVADRAALLCQTAEAAAIATFGRSDIVYVIGTEVPPPGGADEQIDSLQPTSQVAAQETLACHRELFANKGLTDAWQRVVAMVVQPGVEFDNTQVFDYKPNEASALKDFIRTVDRIAFEAHSTDYQTAGAYQSLVADHFAILKVGPELTFALREGLFALHHIEKQLLPDVHSQFIEVVDEVMLAEPTSWQRFYHGESQQLRFLRQFSFSDRIRYYWHQEAVQKALATMLENLARQTLPLPLISQYFPELYQQVRRGEIERDAKALVIAKIQRVVARYSNACFAMEKAS